MMWYVVVFTYGDSDGALTEVVGPLDVTNPEQAVIEGSTTPFVDAVVYPISCDVQGNPLTYNFDDLDLDKEEIDWEDVAPYDEHIQTE